MQRQKRVGIIVFSAQKRADTHFLDVLFRRRHHLFQLGNKLFFLGFLDQIDDLACVVERLAPLCIRSDFPFDRGNFAPDLGRALQILPNLGLFLFGFQFAQPRGNIVDIEGVFRLAERFFKRFYF